MLAGLNCTDNIHLVVGTNPLAAARCTQSLAAGAHPIVVAPQTAELHYGLQRRIDDGSVKWVREAFADEHLFRLGRQEVGGVVDAVFVTAAGAREELGE
jgi:uroporphyrin-III C-methyltransferase